MSLTDDHLRALLEGAVEPGESTGVLQRVAARKAKRRTRRRRAATSALLAIFIVTGTLAVRSVDDAGVDRVAVGGGTETTAPPATDVPPPSAVHTTELPVARIGPGAAVTTGEAWLSGHSREGLEGDVLVRLDASSQRVLATIQLAHPVAALALDPDGREVWAVGGGDGAVPTGSVSRVDAATNRVSGHLELQEGAPQSVAVGAGAVWVADAAAGRVWRIDPGTARVTGAVEVGGSATSVAVEGSTVWVTNNEAVVRIDSATGRVKGTTPLPRARALSATRSVVWAGTDRAVARLDPNSGKVIDTVPLAAEPSTVALGSGWVWVTEFESGSTRKVSRVEAERGLPDPRPVYEASGDVYAAFVVGEQLWVLDSTRAAVVRLPLPLPAGLDLPGETLAGDGEAVALVTAVDVGAPAIELDLIEQLGPGPESARVAALDGEDVEPGAEVGYRRNRDGRRHRVPVASSAQVWLLDASDLRPVRVDLATFSEAMAVGSSDGAHHDPTHSAFRVRLAGGRVVSVEQLYQE